MDKIKDFFKIVNIQLKSLGFSQNKGKTWYKFTTDLTIAIVFDRSKYSAQYYSYIAVSFKNLESHPPRFDYMDFWIRLSTMSEFKKFDKEMLDFENNTNDAERQKLADEFVSKLENLMIHFDSEDNIKKFLLKNPVSLYPISARKQLGTPL